MPILTSAPLPKAPAKKTVKEEDGAEKIVDADPAEQATFNECIKRHVRKEEELDQHIQQTCPIVWRQCTTTLQNKLKTAHDCQRIHDEQDAVELLKATHDTDFQVEANKHKCEGYRTAENNLLNCKQLKDETVADCCK